MNAPVASNLAPTVATESLLVGSAGQLITLMADGSDPEGEKLTDVPDQKTGAYHDRGLSLYRWGR